ncbi:MAG: geranylgeranylglyceryl/heptaprenylglyceryl phosphate synthase [Thermoplasmata archaeon]
MKAYDYILKKAQDGEVHKTLIDPDKKNPAEVGRMAGLAVELGSDAIMIEGSTGVDQENLDGTVKENVKVPTIPFPGGAHTISRYADAIYFMSILDSRNVKNVIGEQRKASLVIKRLGIVPIPMGYLIIEPDMTVGKIGEASLIPMDNPGAAMEYALAVQYLGMKLIYLEAGSGAPAPVPQEMINRVKGEIEIPLVIGGGIRNPEDAGTVARAGADIAVTGTIVELDKTQSILGGIIESVKSARLER